MAKDKKGSKTAAAVAPTKASKSSSKPIEKVQAGRVSKSDKTSSKEAAKKTAKAVEKKSKKSKKEPTPEPSSESDAETSDSSDSSDSEEEAEVKKSQVNGKAKPAAKDDSSDDSDSDSDSDSEAVAPKTNGAAKAAASDSSDSDDSSDSESEAAPAPKKTEAKVNGKAAKKEESSDSDDSDGDSESEEEKPKAAAAKKAEASSDDSSDSSDSDEEEEDKPVAKTESKKRKADTEPEEVSKKAKTAENPDAVANLFVGNLSWSVDEEWLTREFEEFGELAGVRIITDRDSGRSKGFGYVEFTNAADAAKALEAKNESELDGRNIRVDFSTPRDKNAGPQQRSNDRQQKFGDTPGEPTATIWCGNLSFDATEDVVREYFSEHGNINSVRLPTDRETGAPKGFGYIEMGSVEEAQAAYNALQGQDVGGRPVRLDYAQPRPPREDGGFGGGRGGGRGGFGGGRGGGRGGFGDRGGRGGRGGGRGGFGDRGRGGRGGRGGASTNRGGFGDFQGQKKSFD